MKSEFRVWKSCLSLNQTAVIGVLDGVWVRFHSLMKVMKSELQHYCRQGYGLFWQYSLLHMLQTGTPRTRAGRGVPGSAQPCTTAPSSVPQGTPETKTARCAVTC